MRGYESLSITTIFDFIDTGDYTLTNVGFAANKASLSLVANTGQTFSQALTSSVGFTFDSTKTQISGGVLTQITANLPSLLAYLEWSSQLDGNYGTGSLTVTAFGGAAISGGVLDLTGGGSKYVTIPSLYGLNKVNTYAFKYKPNYSGAPGGYQVIIAGSSTANNYFGFYHTPTGHIVAHITDISGGVIVDADFGAWNPVSGTTYTLVFQIDVLNGATKLFIDGVQLGATFTETGNRSIPDIIFIGTDSFTSGANFSISALAIYSAIVGPSNLTPLNDTVYVGDTITFPVFNYSGIGSIIDWSGFTTTSDANSPGYIMNGQYWNGAAWVSSDGTYAQTNTKAVVNAHIAALPNNNSLVVQVVTQSVNSSPASITGPLVVTYTGQIYTSGTILSNSGLMAETLLSFSSVLSETGSDTVSFALQVNAVLMYWDGMAWAASDGTYAQTNTAAEMLANVDTLLTVNSIVKLYVLLVSGTGATTPDVDSVTLVYNFGQLAPNAPETTIVYGFLSDIQGNPVAAAQIIFSLVNIVPNAYNAGADHILIPGSVTTTTDVNGYFQQAVIATTQFEGENTFVQVVIKKGSVTENVGPDGNPLYIQIPIQATIDITTLLSA